MSAPRRRLKGWMVIVLTTITTGYAIGVMIPAMAHLQQVSADHKKSMLDTQVFYDGTAAYNLLDAKGPEGRAWHKTISMRQDFIFPLIYGPFLIIAIVYFLQSAFPDRKGLGWLILLPLIGMVFDYAENHYAVMMIDNYPARNLALGNTGGIMTLVKWIFAVGSAVALLVSFALFIRKRMQQ